MADNQQKKTNFIQNRSGRKSTESEFEYGKKMPQAVDLEEAVLGSILIDKDAWFR